MKRNAIFDFCITEELGPRSWVNFWQVMAGPMILAKSGDRRQARRDAASYLRGLSHDCRRRILSW